MLRIFILISACFFTNLSFSQPTTHYQIDIIIFAHHTSSLQPIQNTTSPMLSGDRQHAISLQNGDTSAMAYHILPNSASQLRNEYWTLSHNPEYQIITSLSWIQPSSNQRAVALPQINHNGWNLEGTLRIRQSNYYLLDTELLFTALSNQPIAFIFSQKQRLKPGTVYYLDHPHAGMLIKVHQVS